MHSLLLLFTLRRCITTAHSSAIHPPCSTKQRKRLMLSTKLDQICRVRVHIPTRSPYTPSTTLYSLPTLTFARAHHMLITASAKRECTFQPSLALLFLAHAHIYTRTKTSTKCSAQKLLSNDVIYQVTYGIKVTFQMKFQQFI